MTSAAEIIADLRQPWRHGEHLDARGIKLDEPLVLDGLDIRGVDLSEARLLGGLSAKGTQFRGLAWMRGAQIAGTCDLRGARFRSDLRADGLTAERVVLDACDLQGVLSLAQAHMSSLSLRHALVMANITLEGATIRNSADLTRTEGLGGLWAAGARIGTWIRDGAEFSGRVHLPV